MRKTFIKVRSRAGDQSAIVDVSLIRKVTPNVYEDGFVGSLIDIGKDERYVYSSNTPDEIFDLMKKSQPLKLEVNLSECIQSISPKKI